MVMLESEVAELDGVVQKVVEDLLDLSSCPRRRSRWLAARIELDGDLLLVQVPSKEAAVFLMTSCMSKSSLFRQNVLGVKLVQGQKILGQVRQPLCLKEDDIQVFLLHFRRDGPVRHGLHIALDGGEGRAEIVGDVGHEFFLVVLHVPQLRGHVVQGGGQIAHLVLGWSPGSRSPDCRRRTGWRPP